MSDRPQIAWSNHCIRKHGLGIRKNILRSYQVHVRAREAAARADQLEREELAALIKFEPMGPPN